VRVRVGGFGVRVGGFGFGFGPDLAQIDVGQVLAQLVRGDLRRVFIDQVGHLVRVRGWGWG